jgi:hypothetical protein
MKSKYKKIDVIKLKEELIDLNSVQELSNFDINFLINKYLGDVIEG